MSDKTAASQPTQPPETEPEQPPEASGKGAAAEARTTRGSLRSQLLVIGLCVLVGLGASTQAQQTQEDELVGMRQDDLVRLLDEITERNTALTEEADRLREDRDALLSGSDASLTAEEYLDAQQIIAGVAPAEGTGILLDISDAGRLQAHHMVTVLEELRNAGAEAIEVAGVRVVATTSFTNGPDGVQVDGVPMGESMQWRVIGDPATLAGALGIAGGALSTLREQGAQVQLSERDLVQVTAIRELPEPEFAVPISSED